MSVLGVLFPHPAPPSLAAYDVTRLEALLGRWGLPASHARRVLRHYYDTAGAAPDGPRFPRALLARLGRELPLLSSAVALRRVASDGTVKLLVSFGAAGETDDGLASRATAECVLMPSHRPDRAAGCLSSQIGCAMGCDFCASTKAGLQRDLTAGEIVEQFLHLRREALGQGRRLQTVVFMGMGEPLLNYANVVDAIRRIAGQDLGALGWRQVTVSTVGIVPGIDRLREEGLGVQLAVSLHAPDDDTRAAIVPAGRKYRVADIVGAAYRYQEATGRVVNIEYTMLAGVNDADAQAELLADRLAGLRMHVNLIPYNWIGPGVSGREYRQPEADRMARFAAILNGRGGVAHVRRTRGQEIEGACGQLRERALGVGD